MKRSWSHFQFCLTSASQGFLFVFPPLVTFALAYSTYECHHSLDKCHTPLIQPYIHKLPTCCLHVDACLMFVVLGYISTWLLLFFLRPPFSETLSLDSIILATCFLIFLISSCLTISTSTYFSTSFIHYLCWFMDDLTLEKTHQVRNLWHCVTNRHPSCSLAALFLPYQYIHSIGCFYLPRSLIYSHLRLIISMFKSSERSFDFSFIVCLLTFNPLPYGLSSIRI